MNAVNLLPAKHRPRTPTGGQQGSSYIVIGVLGVALLMVLLYVLTVNGINTKKDSLARTKAETAQAQKRSAELASYGNFTQVKEQRVSSVKGLATGRIDWERLARGLAHVLPQNVWLLSADAKATPEGEDGEAAAPPAQAPPAPAPAAGGGAAPAAPAAPAEPAGPGPKMTLKGCSPDHSNVAITLVRLRHLPNVDEVSLVSAVRPPKAQKTPGSPAEATQPAGEGGGDDCGSIKKRSALTFEAVVTFKPLPGSEIETKDKVPTSLGGGA